MKKSFFILLILPLLIAACSEDKDPAPEIELPIEVIASGDYEFEALLTLVSDRNSRGTVSGEAKLSTTSGNGMKFTMIIDGESLIVNLTGITESANGFVFNVQTDTGTDFEVRGMNSVSLGAQSYHGRYDKEAEQLKLNLYVDITEEGSEDNDYEMEILANQKSGL